MVLLEFEITNIRIYLLTVGTYACICPHMSKMFSDKNLSIQYKYLFFFFLFLLLMQKRTPLCGVRKKTRICPYSEENTTKAIIPNSRMC